ncbi:MAG TPA: hypothetical protein VJ935_12310, partial [Acidimicrobiia bacterium]|nr:hypothetical protein [Acidimicrobiia bacterium]
ICLSRSWASGVSRSAIAQRAYLSAATRCLRLSGEISVAVSVTENLFGSHLSASARVSQQSDPPEPGGFPSALWYERRYFGGKEVRLRFLRLLVALTLFSATLAACGGEDAQSTADDTSAPTSGEVTAATPTSGAESTGTTQSEGGGATSGQGSITYEISGGFEAAGEEPFNPTMSFFDQGVWTLTFGGGASLLVLGLDPSTPSISWTSGTASAGADSSNCEFDITRQDADGASGSFSCSAVAVVNEGALTEAASFTGTFDANP